MSKLLDYLKGLNSAESQWGIWVNPENPQDEYRVGQYCFENGGVKDDWIHIGSLDDLSYGFQSMSEAIESYLSNLDCVQFKGRKVRVNKKAIVEAWSNGSLDDEFREFLESEAEAVKEVWADCEASAFVYDEMPEKIAAVLKERSENLAACR